MYDMDDYTANEVQFLLDAMKSIKVIYDAGYDVSDFKCNGVMGHSDMSYLQEQNLEMIIALIYGNSYKYYQSDEDDAQKVGYAVRFYDEEYVYNVFQITSKHIMRLLKILKEHNIHPSMVTCIDKAMERAVDSDWVCDMENYNQGKLGDDYSGLYIISAYYAVDLVSLAKELVGINEYSKQIVEKYYSEKKVTLLIDGKETALKKPRVRRRKWRYRDRYREQLIEKYKNKIKIA